MDGCGFKGKEFIVGLDAEGGLVVGWTWKGEGACHEGGLTGLGITDEAEFDLLHLFGCGNA